jgi:hypothetical protein
LSHEIYSTNKINGRVMLNSMYTMGVYQLYEGNFQKLEYYKIQVLLAGDLKDEEVSYDKVGGFEQTQRVWRLGFSRCESYECLFVSLMGRQVRERG